MIGYYSTILKDKDVSSNVKRMILMERAGLKVPPNKKNDAEEELDKTKLKDDALEKTFSDVKDDEFEYELEEIIKELEDYIDDKEEEEEDVVDFLKNIDFDCVCK
tara:strand:+ start:20380 stop:20694 length:315 start_codon:yes stop_codon:yes gene_type:complete